MLIEELTQIPDEKRYLQLIASCRSTVPELKPQIFCTTNPGGVGHVWVKKRFVDVAEPNTVYVDPTSTRKRIYIPATIDDNPTLITNDPDYVKQLDALKDTDEELWKAWRLGDWNTFAGQFYKEFRTGLHTRGYYLPFKNNVIIGGLDWGRADPFACEFTEIQAIDFNGVKFYRATTFCEIYGTERNPKDWGDEIKKKLDNFGLTLKDIAWVRCDNQIYNKGLDNSKSIHLQFVDSDEQYQSLLKPASKERIGGWVNLHNWLSLAPDGLPYWQISQNCQNLIRTLPSLIHDENKPEDIDQSGEDHAPDSCFVAGTKIKTIHGDIPIEEIVVGDKVLTRVGYKKVVVSRMMGEKQTLALTFSNGIKIVGTANHPIYVNGKWKKLCNIRYGDKPLSYSDKKFCIKDGDMGLGLITKKEKVLDAKKSLGATNTLKKGCAVDSVIYAIGIEKRDIVPTYNLQVEGQPEYFANGVLVHNCRYMFKHLKWIDAKVGGVLHTQMQPMIKTSQFIGDKQLSVNLDRFATPNQPINDTGVGAIVH